MGAAGLDLEAMSGGRRDDPSEPASTSGCTRCTRWRRARSRLQLVVTSQPLSASGARPGLQTELLGKARRLPGTPIAARVELLPREPVTVIAKFPISDGS